MKIKTTLRNLSDLDVKWVSLVDRGANRIPFRIIKRDPQKEQSMAFNLSDLGRRLRKAEPPKEQPTQAPSVEAVILAKGDKALAEKVSEVLKSGGLELSCSTVFEDGTVALSASEQFTPSDDSAVVRLTENVAVVIKGFEPFGQALSALPFGEQAAARGYYDSVRGALDTLNSMVMDRLYKADSPSAAVSEIEPVLGAFQSYVVAMTSALPASLFKAEGEVERLVSPWEAKAVEAPVTKADEQPQAEVAKAEEFKPCDECADPEACKAKGVCKAEADEEDAEEVAKKVEKAEPAAVEPQKDERIEKLLETMNSVVTAVTDIKKSVEGLSSKVEKIDEQGKATEQKLAEVTKKAEDAAHVLKTTVVASETGGDPDQKAPVVKSEGHELSGVFDTALLPRNRTRR